MNLKEKLEIKKREDETSLLRRQLADSKKQLSLAINQLSTARNAKFGRLKTQPPRPKLKGDIIRMICCDLHGAKMDRKAAEAFLSDVKRLQPQEIYLLGDMVDCGGFLAQHHTLGYVAEMAYSYDDDILAANRFLDALQAAAPEALIEYVEGNHENRIERWAVTQALAGGSSKDAEGLRRRNAPEFLLKLAERGIKYYRMSVCYDGLAVQGFLRRGKCFYTHGSFVTAKHATAKIQAKISGNVVYGNTHREQAERVRRVSSGFVGAWNPGCLCVLQPLWRNTDPSDWSHGYAIQFVARSQNFLHVNIPLIGESLLSPFLAASK
jgi:predicted phosphodiesterase